MKVHMVGLNLHQDRVLTRLAKALAAGTGWTLSEKINPSADVNYFFPYLTYRNCPTQTAAWFTHYDSTKPAKAKRWEEVAEKVDIALTSAPMYLKKLQDGQVVTPPIDAQFFEADLSRLPNTVKTLGVSGFVYGDGRKGEDLIHRLAETKLSQPVRWKASGEGWAVQTRQYTWQQMVKFYQSLDVLIVPSRIEGIPMPPLEALACGVKVVIPRKVGMLDELPEMAGIYRFEAGEFASLREAVEEAISDTREIRGGDLRKAVEGYTVEAWCESHVGVMAHNGRAVARPYEAMHGEKIAGEIPEKCGVYYVAYGKPARDCVRVAMASWKKHMPDVPMALVSDKSVGIEDVFIEEPDRDLGGRAAKLKVDELAPSDWDYVLYLDADTEIVADVRFLFQVLEDGWDMVICKDSAKYATTKRMVRPDNHDEVKATWKLMGCDDLLQLNGGVFGFRRGERTRAFFKAWYDEWQRWGKRDQAALLRALWRNPLKIYVLGNEWNTVTRYMDASKTAGILHYPMTARRWHGIVQERLDDPEAFKRIVK